MERKLNLVDEAKLEAEATSENSRSKAGIEDCKK